MLKKDLNIRKVRKEVRKELEQERSDIVKCIRENDSKIEIDSDSTLIEERDSIAKCLRDSDLDHVQYMELIKEIDAIDKILDNKRKSKLDEIKATDEILNNKRKSKLEEVKEIDYLLDKKKSKIDPAIIVAIINGVISVGMFAGLLVYENRDIIHAKAAERIMEKGIKR